MADDRVEMLWQSYFIPDTTVLRNDLGITDAAALGDAEYAIAGQRLQQLERGELQIPRTFDDAHLAAIHKHLFQDCYAWAGQPRYVDMAKAPSSSTRRSCPPLDAWSARGNTPTPPG